MATTADMMLESIRIDRQELNNKISNCELASSVLKSRGQISKSWPSGRERSRSTGEGYPQSCWQSKARLVEATQW